ncbi:hypothetical protein HAX54_052575, partial [Datura stramonium]|nr:hypothetical protein [Datura stramonium]
VVQVGGNGLKPQSTPVPQPAFHRTLPATRRCIPHFEQLPKGGSLFITLLLIIFLGTLHVGCTRPAFCELEAAFH